MEKDLVISMTKSLPTLSKPLTIKYLSPVLIRELTIITGSNRPMKTATPERVKTRSFETDNAPSVSSVATSNVGIDTAYVDFKIKDSSSATIVYGESTSYGGTVSVSTSTEESSYSARISGLKDRDNIPLQDHTQRLGG